MTRPSRTSALPDAAAHDHLPGMFVVSEAEAAAIRAAYEQGGELSAAIELRRLFPGITDNAKARECARTIVGAQCWRKKVEIHVRTLSCQDSARLRRGGAGSRRGRGGRHSRVEYPQQDEDQDYRQDHAYPATDAPCWVSSGAVITTAVAAITDAQQ
jgi:hypothetical protein